jgi:hypothetical protein
MNIQTSNNKVPFEEKIIQVVGILISLAPLIVLAAAFIANEITPIPDKQLTRIILGSLFFIALQIAISLELRVRNIERLTSDTCRRMESPICSGYVNNLESIDAWYNYVADETRKAEKSIKDASLTSRKWPMQSAAEKRYRSERKSAICNEKIAYKYLTVFQEDDDTSRLDDIIEWVRESGWNHDYQARYLSSSGVNYAVLFNFVIIDEKEVIIAFYSEKSGPSEQSVSISNNKEAVRLFSDYFDYLFDKAVMINTQKGIETDVVEKIRAKLTPDRA